mgnify:CR=1 FL=1
MTIRQIAAAQLHGLVGAEVALSDWFTVTQSRIDEFADAIEDRQWIHIDPKRAAHESPFGTTIAHGFLTLSLLSHLFESAIHIEGTRLGINYGLNRVRFSGPVPAGSRIRGRFVLSRLQDLADGVQMTWHVNVEREGVTKPVLVSEWLTRSHL